jgi:hypothetical protein
LGLKIGLEKFNFGATYSYSFSFLGLNLVKPTAGTSSLKNIFNNSIIYTSFFFVYNVFNDKKEKVKKELEL